LKNTEEGLLFKKKNYATITISIVQWKANQFYYLELKHTSEYVVYECKLLCSDSTRCEMV